MITDTVVLIAMTAEAVETAEADQVETGEVIAEAAEPEEADINERRLGKWPAGKKANMDQ